MTVSRRKKKAKQGIISEAWALVEEKLRLDWSPEQISGWLKKNTKVQVSHESIYQYIYADKRADWQVNHKRVSRLMQEMGLRPDPGARNTVQPTASMLFGVIQTCSRS